MLKLYFTLVVFSYKTRLEEEQKGSRNDGTTFAAAPTEIPTAPYPQQQTVIPGFYEQQPAYSAPYAQQPLYPASSGQQTQYPPPYETTENSYPHLPHVKQ